MPACSEGIAMCARLAGRTGGHTTTHNGSVATTDPPLPLTALEMSVIAMATPIIQQEEDLSALQMPCEKVLRQERIARVRWSEEALGMRRERACGAWALTVMRRP